MHVNIRPHTRTLTQSNDHAQGCAVWSIATALEAFTSSTASLIPLRSIVGASQAFYNPAAYTLLADIFPQRLIARVNGCIVSFIHILTDLLI